MLRFAAMCLISYTNASVGCLLNTACAMAASEFISIVVVVGSECSFEVSIMKVAGGRFFAQYNHVLDVKKPYTVKIAA